MTTETTTDADIRARALEVHRRLLRTYGEPQRRANPDAVSVLVSTIISQNTNDQLRDRAFDRLRDLFPTWEQVRDAPEEAIAEAIRIGGLGEQKARTIKSALQHISEQRGGLTLDFLKEMPLEEARQWLLSLDGVGPKTAAIVLLFALGMPAFPVDTHVHRASRRLGLIPPKASREKAHTLLEMLLPEGVYYPFHINLIRHGRAVCHARSPRCHACPLQDVCDYYANEERGGG